jgi:hypothetical protein
MNQLKRLFVCEYDKRKLMCSELESMEVEVTVFSFKLSSGTRVAQGRLSDIPCATHLQTFNRLYNVYTQERGHTQFTVKIKPINAYENIRIY